MKYLLSAIIAAALTAGAIYAYQSNSQLLRGNGGLTASKCTASTTVWTVGHQEATTVLPARENRATAFINPLANATNIFSIAVDGAVAVANSDLLLTGSSTPLKFGRATDFPYVGAVSVITNNSSTSLVVSECLY